ncbi:hypothetical protein GOP47_0012411 [Adiantum capillus-veneris]|uniref:Chitinase n=1 Tax=Adiantum capillus-veneris TaxID=13818 RepID=A0A9D4UQY8_ADICA|nr:hypothetical protein GOP47_0012411 [Adiantum capillus-veneris]
MRSVYLLALGLVISTFFNHENFLVMADCSTYIVEPGDTCYAISQAYGISLSDFQSWNAGINCNNLQIGQSVCISKPTASSPSGSTCTTYTIKFGDTCYAISQAHGISLSEFQSWNAGINCNNLQIGQIVCVSKPAAAPAPSSQFNGKTFREYIGALYNGVHFTDVPIRNDVTFHFILAFAIDYASASAPTNGGFKIYWQNAVLTPDTVKAIKAQHQNVKVMVSLGGDTISDQFVQFKATSVDSWVTNAVSSLTSLINEYHLDGIDIDFEHFDGVSTQTFVSCIGQLITQLKAKGVISVASIAPFDGVESQYTALWGQYSSVIDLVNFQFYSYGGSVSASQYVSLYNTAAAKYGGGAKVLVSFSTGGVGPAPSTVLSACQQLKASGKLPGIFIFSADGSYASSTKFQYEEQAQALLAS